MKMNRSLVLLTMGLALSLTLLSTVNSSAAVADNFYLCNQGDWYHARGSGQVQINICSKDGSGQGSVQYAIKHNDATIASGGCNGGPCSNPTAGGVSADSYMILRFYPSSIAGIQVIELDSEGNARQVWVPYNQNYYQSNLNCNPYYQYCFTQTQSYCTYSQSCSAVIFRIATTPITVNIFFSL
jgi:hypothetical protein